MPELPLDQTRLTPRPEASPDASSNEGVDVFARTVHTPRDAAALGAPPPPPVNSRPLTAIGPYRIIRKLGEGGMGAVFLGENADGGPQVAIKVLHRDAVPDEASFRRFEKEARLLSEVRHPNVTNLLDVGRASEASYLVMEYVCGLDVKQLIAARGALTERAALLIVRDVAAALEAAHRRGIIHRDIKPGNVLIGVEESLEFIDRDALAEDIVKALDQGQQPVIKLSDFGLARHTDQTESLNLTKTGAMLGTPYYIAPEQCAGKGDVTPAADVYSLGAMLFELLANRPPFKAADAMKVIALHCFEEAPDIRKLAPAVSDATARLLSTTLQKSPEARFPDAGRLRAEIERLLRGDCELVADHPVAPAATAGVIETTWQWDLEGPLDELWPLASNTDRINSAVGLPSVQYRTDRDEHGAIRKFGEFQLGFAKLVWQEFPFEWIEGRRLGVLREFTTGPFRWFLSIVELERLAQGGTRLKHTVRIAPKGLLGRLLAFLEVNIKGSKALDRIYRRMDAVVCGKLKGAQTVDPFVPPPSLARTTVRKFAVLQAELEACDIDAACADALVRFLQESPAADLARIRPHELARRLSLPVDRFTEACLQACHAGLLALHWDILCPTCRISASVKDTLAAIDQHSYCEACDLDFALDFGNAVELIFRVHPQLRQADLKTYCLGGPEHAPHVVAQTRLAAGEVLDLDLSLHSGSYQLRGPQLAYTLPLKTEAAHPSTGAHVVLGSEPQVRKPITLRSGRQTVTLENPQDRPLLVRIERVISRTDILTAVDAGRLPLFRKLFPAEVISREQLSDFSACTLLGVRVLDMADIYDRFGDVEGGRRLQDTMTATEEHVIDKGGQVVRKSDGQLLASFAVTGQAIEALADIQNGAVGSGIELRFALHRGAALSTSVDGRMNFAGRIVAQTNALLEDRSDRRLVLSSDLVADVEVLELLAKHGLMVAAERPAAPTEGRHA